MIEIIAILLFTFWGWRLLDGVARIYETSFHSLSLLICVGFGLFFQVPVHNLGHILGGLMGGGKLIAFQFFRGNYVLEKGKFLRREKLAEQDMIPVIVCPRDHASGGFLCLYWLGGAMANFLLTVIAYILLRTGMVPCHSLMGSMMFALFITGLWSLVDSMIPIYRMAMPNDCLKLLILLSNRMERSYYDLVFRRLLDMSEEKEAEDDFSAEIPADSDGQLGLFQACWLLRGYEAKMWQGRYDEASEFLKAVYLARRDLPDDWTDLISSEVISCLSLLGQQEALDVTDLMVTDSLRIRLENSGRAGNMRGLYLWSLHHVELEKKQKEYYQQAKRSIADVAFAYARKGWMVKAIHG